MLVDNDDERFFFNVSKNVSSLAKTSVLKRKPGTETPVPVLFFWLGQQMVNFPNSMEK